MSHLLGLESENVKRLRLVRLALKERGVTIVAGNNEAGKTSFVESIDYLFGGAKTHPPEVIRLGEEHAKVVGETEDLLATRKWWRTPDGVKTELEVTAKADGQTLRSPQAVLDKLYEHVSDPTAFFRMKKADRLDWLRKVVGVDTTLLERQLQKVFDERTVVDRDLRAAKARLGGMPADKPPAPVDTAALLAEQAAAQRLQQVCAEAMSVQAASLRRMDDTKGAVHVAEMALEQALTRHQLAMKHAADAETAAEAAAEAADGTAATLERVRGQLATATAIGMANARWTEREKAAAEVERLAADAAGKSEEVEKLRKTKEDLLVNAKFPLPGLGFGDDDVTFNGLPLEQTSGAQRIRLGAALIIARNPKMRLMRVPEGANLDEDNLAALDEACVAADFQCIVERVGESGPATVVIRDGLSYKP